MKNIEDLPIPLLEHLFMFVEDRMLLRLVSKSFKTIIDGSQLLMQKYSFNVTESKVDDLKGICPQFSELKFYNLTPKEFNFVFNYPHKDKITSIFIEAEDSREMKRSLFMLQQILLSFENLEELYIVIRNINDCKCFENDTRYNKYYRYDVDEVKLIALPQTKLRMLSIFSFNDMTYLLYAFANVKSIKILNLFCTRIESFPEVEWKLEEFRFEFDLTDKIEMVKAFLEKQMSTLKLLETNTTCEMASFIAKKLPNITSITILICTTSENTIFDNIIIKNHETKKLALKYHGNNVNGAESILKHYQNVEVLNIQCNSHPEMEFKHLKFPNVKSLLISTSPININIIVNAEFPSLKVLDLLTYKPDYSKFNDIPEANLMNVEKMTINFAMDIDNLAPMLRKCKNLRHFNIGSDRDTRSQPLTFHDIINKLLEIAPKLECVGILEEDLICQSTLCSAILSRVKSEKLVIKVYDEVPSMMNGHWKFGDKRSHRFYELACSMYDWC